MRVFHTLYHHRVAPLAERTHPMWTYGGRSDLDRVSLKELPDDKIWNHVGRVLQLRPRETVVGKSIPFNASIVPTLVCSLILFMLFLCPLFFISVHSFRRGLGGTSPSCTFLRGWRARPSKSPRRR